MFYILLVVTFLQSGIAVAGNATVSVPITLKSMSDITITNNGDCFVNSYPIVCPDNVTVTLEDGTEMPYRVWLEQQE